MIGPSYTAEQIAWVCHEANRALQGITGDPAPSPAWDDAPEWQRASAIAGVVEALRGATSAELHQAWCDLKVAEGWTFGLVKDVEARTHPCLVPYGDLPAEQRVKDELFGSIVRALSASPVNPRVRVHGPVGRRTVVIDGYEIPRVKAVQLAEAAGEYQLVSIDVVTDDAEFESPQPAHR
jgi:hypothetical protein